MEIIYCYSTNSKQLSANYHKCYQSFQCDMNVRQNKIFRWQIHIGDYDFGLSKINQTGVNVIKLFSFIADDKAK
jgi:hypothetical protein